MVTLPGGRFWSFCCCAAVLGMIVLKPEATSVLSLFCVLVCVVEQLTKNAAHAAAMLVKKRYLIGFIGRIAVGVNKFLTKASERDPGGDLRAVCDSGVKKTVVGVVNCARSVPNC